jgi:hypothetical protein
MDAFVFPTGQLELGPKIGSGSYGAVHKAKLHGVWVCAKVRRGAVDAGRGSVAVTPLLRAAVHLAADFVWRMAVRSVWVARS